MMTSSLWGKSLSGKIGVCCGNDSWELVGKYGYDYIETSVVSFLIPTENDSAFSERYKEASSLDIPVYSCNSFFPATMRLVGKDVNTEEIRQYVETAMKRAEKMHIEVIVLGSGKARSIPDDFAEGEARSQFVSICRMIGDIAQKSAITVVIEPLRYSETNFINSVEEGLRMVKEINHPNIRLLADIYHMVSIGESPESIVKAGKYLKHCHIAEKEKRTPPGVEKDDFTPYLKALKQIGYKGKISLECVWEDKEQQLPVALKELKKQILEVGL
ncbi:MAG: sugar phosphate isomerase/epimerase [Bacteroidales bacterium]|nr:sugar phosphate isomerase/epimerase [Bacteroidales bacterium]